MRLASPKHDVAGTRQEKISYFYGAYADCTFNGPPDLAGVAAAAAAAVDPDVDPSVGLVAARSTISDSAGGDVL
ncbi:hypothetical protein ACLKA6_017317 [Drosophila palustris]